MNLHNDFSSLLSKFQCANRYAQYAALQDVAASLQDANKNNIQELMELLTSTYDVELQIKLFSVLAAYLINNGVHYDVIVKYQPVYETIQNILVQGLPVKAAVVLNFVMALLSYDDAWNLTTHARNMIRVSGCLNAMSDTFSSSMMYQDTWIALCQSLAETIRGSEVNQSYCSHLVPVCVQRCRQGNVDVCPVLQTLIHNHKRNLQLFIESEGLNIFTRQLLQYNMGLQLLNTTVKNSPIAVTVLQTTDIVYHLRDFLRLYGPYSQMGQWSTIILYHLNKEAESSILITTTKPTLNDVKTENVQRRPLHQDRTFEIMNENFNKPCYDAHNYNNNVDESNVIQTATHAGFQHAFHDIDNKQEDTATLFQNIIKEVLNWKSKENSNSFKQYNLKKNRNFANDPAHVEIRPTTARAQTSYSRIPTKNIKANANEEDLTFSFLMEEKIQESRKPFSTKQNDKIIRSFLTPCSSSYKNITSYDNRVQTEQTNHDFSNNSRSYYDYNTVLNMRNFNPPFISTPKRDKTDKTNASKISHRSKASNKYSRQQKKKHFAPADKFKLYEISQNVTKEVKHQSISERFLNAINESCTTIVKSVKSIFRPKQNKERFNNTDDGSNNEEENTNCNYSFTNYMRKRDALLKSEFSQNDESSSDIYKVDSCKTCRDTIILQQKMKKDDHLRQTVRKLKMAINLYGCDFKKISHALWPRDRYATPEMLYNLYRKLIVKGGHDNHSFRLKAHNAMKRK